jgi:diguanylate cyclase (GGDEF)-like protein
MSETLRNGGRFTAVDGFKSKLLCAPVIAIESQYFPNGSPSGLTFHVDYEVHSLCDFCFGMAAYYPNVRIEGEVWNLPKYVVAVGMILLLLEDQIAHNKYLAFHDELTGLPNRRLFQDRLTVALERARRTNDRAALLLIDLDRFKQVNDAWGHHTGDLLLQQVSLLFSGRVRTCDTVARTGGDEFSVILEGISSNEGAQQVAESLLENLTEPLEIDGRTIHIGASIGVAVYPDDALEMEALCIAADMRMYDEKNIARAMNKRSPGKILPQSLRGEAVQPVASEGYSA